MTKQTSHWEIPRMFQPFLQLTNVEKQACRKLQCASTHSNLVEDWPHPFIMLSMRWTAMPTAGTRRLFKTQRLSTWEPGIPPASNGTNIYLEPASIQANTVTWWISTSVPLVIRILQILIIHCWIIYKITLDHTQLTDLALVQHLGTWTLGCHRVPCGTLLESLAAGAPPRGSWLHRSVSSPSSWSSATTQRSSHSDQGSAGSPLCTAPLCLHVNRSHANGFLSENHRTGHRVYDNWIMTFWQLSILCDNFFNLAYLE